MKFIADMGISQTTVQWLKEQGFDAVHVRDMGMHRSPGPHLTGCSTCVTLYSKVKGGKDYACKESENKYSC
ncbi:DUF5615 family PIN-like protein [Dissulfurispira sp.]|uniref:DUF5615 family PIN-like protein n=1 Tax=Dissulfurispira sp. TaxID=2817609 RepID=UPI003FA5BE09